MKEGFEGRGREEKELEGFASARASGRKFLKEKFEEKVQSRAHARESEIHVF